MSKEKLEVLQDQHLDMMLHLAFLMEEDEEIEKLMNLPVSELTREQEALTERAFQKAMIWSKKQQKREARKRHLGMARTVVKRGIEVAACFLIPSNHVSCLFFLRQKSIEALATQRRR